MRRLAVAFTAFALLACAPADKGESKGDLGRQLSLNGKKEEVAAAMSKLDSNPHSWTRAKVPAEKPGAAKVLIKWSSAPTYREIGSIIFIAQSHDLTIADTDIVKAPQ